MPIRWGIIGCGDVARRRVAQAIFDDPESACLAACRRDASKLARFCADFSVPRAYTHHEAVLANRDIDAVYIATPVSAHCEQVLAAAAAGKHVLVEKPMGRSVAECDRMIEACHRAGICLGVAYYRRFYPVVERMQQLLQEGHLGDLLAIGAVTANPFQMSPQDDGYWRVLPDIGGGGALMDIGSHRLNLFLHLAGRVRAVKACCDTVAATYHAENIASLILHFESGAHGSLQCFFGSAFDPDEFTLTGTRGRLRSAPLNGGQLVCELDGTQRIETHPPADNFNTPLIADFVDAVNKNRNPRVTGKEGRDTNAVLANAYSNAQPGT